MTRSATRRSLTPPELLDQFQRAFALCLQGQPAQLLTARGLLLECVQGDPGNLIFVESFLSVLERVPPRRGRWRGFWNRVGFERARLARQWELVARRGPILLVIRPQDGPVLCGLGQALQEMGHQDVALRYWFAAEKAHADNSDVQRQCARAFHRAGLFDQAARCWRRVARQEPDEQEAAEMLRLLDRALTTGNESPPGTLADSTRTALSSVDEVLEESQRRWESGDLVGAREVLSAAASAHPGSLRVVEKLEELDLEAARRRIDTAKGTDNSDDGSLVADLQADLVRQEIEVYGSRAARYPQDCQWKLLLARSLKSAGNFSEACRVLTDLPPESASALDAQLLWGECLQHQHRFGEALEHYESAAAVALDTANPEPTGLLALYRAGVLALQLDQPAVAQRYLQRLLAIRPGYKDARQHLDKIDSIRHKDGFSLDLQDPHGSEDARE